MHVDQEVDVRASKTRRELGRPDGGRGPDVEPELPRRLVNDRTPGALYRGTCHHCDDLRRRLQLQKSPEDLDAGSFLSYDDDSQTTFGHHSAIAMLAFRVR